MTANRWVVTAKFTEDGANAWRRADGTWARTLAEAGLLPDAAAAQASLATSGSAGQREVCDAYVIEVFADGATIDPLSARERIRATGPTISLRRPDAGVRRS